MSSFGLLSLGIQAAQANKAALSVVGQNIANVNTEGYSRQVIDFNSVEQRNGVEVTSIERVTDWFLTKQLWADTAAYGRTDVYAEYASELDDRLATDSTSITSAMDEYFNALQNAVDDPTSLPNRELFIAEAEALTRRFNDLYDIVDRQNEAVNSDLSSYASQVNAYAADIATLNEKISLDTLEGKDSSELKDQRDLVVEKMSELVDVSVVEQRSGEFNVYIAHGEPLVIGGRHNSFTAIDGDPDPSQQEIALQVADAQIDLTGTIKGGKIGGLLEYRDDVLTPAINELGRIAVVFAETMNTQHQQGMDLDNELGGLLFSDVNSSAAITSRVLSNEENINTIETAYVQVTDTASLYASDYELHIDGPSSFTVTRQEDGQKFTSTAMTQVTDEADLADETQAYFLDSANGRLVFVLDGIKTTLDVSGQLAKGDRYTLQPVRQGAGQIDTLISDARGLAFASPVSVDSDADNAGTAEASVTVTDITDPMFQGQASALNPPLRIVFDNSDPITYTVYDVSDDNNPTVFTRNDGTVMQGLSYTSGDSITLDGFEVTLRGEPEAGDRFDFGYNTDGVSDNRNALALSDLQLAATMDDAAYQDIYGSLIERVGTKTSVANINSQASLSVLTASQESKASLTGVSLDEEAANLIQFQQAYQASAQLISTSQTLFDTLLNSF
ncbi:MAG: flagellar hook-associated protein FlgK [Pontibacterium sp.]